VRLGLYSKGGEALKVEVDYVRRSGLDYHLVLVVVLKAVGVLAVPSVGRPARRLHVGDAPGLRAEHAQTGRWIHRPGADLYVVGLLNNATVLRPESFQTEDYLLEVHNYSS